MATQRQRGHDLDLLVSHDVIGLVTIRLPGSTSYGLSIVTMRLSGTVMEMWTFEVLPGRLFQEQRSVVGRSEGRLVGPQYYTDFIYSSSLR